MKSESRCVAEEQLSLQAICEEGDEEAFLGCILKLRAEAFSYVTHYCGSATDAEDIVQQANINALLGFRKKLFDSSKKLRPWYYTVLTRAAIDHARSNNKRRRDVSLDAVAGQEVGEEEAFHKDFLAVDVDPSYPMEIAEEIALMREAMTELKPHLLDALQLVYMKGAKYTEAAEVLQIPLGTVKTHLAVAKRKVAGIMTTDPRRPAA